MNLDVLITISESTPRHYVEECRRSVSVAASQAGYPVNVIEVPGVPGHIGQAMANGFARTMAPYVTWVDDDDFVLPPAFACLQRHFDRRPQAIVTRELHWHDNGTRMTPFPGRHHLTVFRRDAVREEWFSEPVDIRRHVLVEGLDVIDELSWVYVYRIHDSAARRLRLPLGL
jgi:hypothetical protein